MSMTVFEKQYNERTGLWESPKAKAKPLSAEQVEANRAARHADAVAILKQVAVATKQLAELEPSRQNLLTAKDKAAEDCEAICAPLRKELREVEQELSGQPISKTVLIKRRDELTAAIRTATSKLYEKSIAIDDKLRPIDAERAELNAVFRSANAARSDLITFAAPELSARLYVGANAIKWAEARLARAQEKHGTAPTFLTQAEVAAAESWLATARADELEVRREALNID